MFRKNNQNKTDELLDQIGREFVRASSLNDEDIEQIASSPFLVTRLRARIEAARSTEESGDWLAIFGAAWRAVPAMSLAAALAIGLLVFSGGTNGAILNDEQLVATSESSVEGVFLEESEVGPTNDEIISTLTGENEGRSQR